MVRFAVASLIALLFVGPLPADPKAGKDPDDEWKDAKHYVQRGELIVLVGAVRTQKVELKVLGEERISENEQLVVYLKIFNRSPTKKADYRGWTSDVFDREKDLWGRLSDDLGNEYKRITFGASTKVEGQLPRGASVYPEDSVIDLLLFEPPVRRANELRLSLPAQALGEERGVLRLKVPVQRIRPAAADVPAGTLFHAIQDVDKADNPFSSDDDHVVDLDGPEAIIRGRRPPKKPTLVEDPQRDEKAAAGKLKAGKDLWKAGKGKAGDAMFREVIDKFPATAAAAEAKELLGK